MAAVVVPVPRVAPPNVASLDVMIGFGFSPLDPVDPNVDPVTPPSLAGGAED